MYPVLKILPGSQYLWMLRFISIALCMILYSFLKWDTLKKPLVVLFCVILIADIVPSLPLITGDGNNISVSKNGITIDYNNNDSAWDRLDSSGTVTYKAKTYFIG